MSVSSCFRSAMVTLEMNRLIRFRNMTITAICERMAVCRMPRTFRLASIQKSSLAVELGFSEAERRALSF